MTEGILLIALGVAGFVSAAIHPHAPPVGAPVLVLALTPWHSAVLLGFGILAASGTANRRVAIAVTASGTVIFMCLVVIGAVAAAHHAPGPLGLEARDIVLHGVLAAANFAILYWLIPDILEGPDWVNRREPAFQAQAEAESPGSATGASGLQPPAAGCRSPRAVSPVPPLRRV